MDVVVRAVPGITAERFGHHGVVFQLMDWIASLNTQRSLYPLSSILYPLSSILYPA